MENFYGMGRNGIPQRLTGIKIGDIVRIVSLKKINKMKRLGIRIRCSWKNQMDGLCGSQHIITGSEMGRIEYRDAFNQDRETNFLLCHRKGGRTEDYTDNFLVWINGNKAT